MLVAACYMYDDKPKFGEIPANRFSRFHYREYKRREMAQMSGKSNNSRKLSPRYSEISSSSHHVTTNLFRERISRCVPHKFIFHLSFVCVLLSNPFKILSTSKTTLVSLRGVPVMKTSVLETYVCRPENFRRVSGLSIFSFVYGRASHDFYVKFESLILHRDEEGRFYIIQITLSLHSF